MTLQDVLKVIDTLPDDEIAEIQRHIATREKRHSESPTPQEMQAFWSQTNIQAEIQAIVNQAPSIDLRAGTMDADKLMEAIIAMREGLSESELEAIIADMNEEYIEDDAS